MVAPTQLNVQLQHDDDGFLIGKKRIKTLEDKMAATHKNSEAILKHVKVQKTGQRMIVSGRLKLDGNTQAQSANVQRKPVSNGHRPRLANASNSAQQIGNANAAHPLANQGERQKQKQITRQQRRYQEAEAKSNQRQEFHLNEISKSIKQLKTDGLFSSILPLLAGGAGLLSAGGGLIRNLLKAPALLAGAGAGRNRPPTVPPILPNQGGNPPHPPAGSSWGDKILDFGKKFAKGGLLAGFVSLLEGISVEASDMERHEKNKEHAKNFVVAGGGVAGAFAGGAAGAAIGSVVPVIGTAVGAVVGSILGGLSGSAVMDYFVEKIDATIDPALSEKMFGSWSGFMEVMGMASSWVWQQLLPTSINTYFTKLGIDTSSYWSTVTGLATLVWDDISQAGSMFWAKITTSAGMLWEKYVPQFAQDFFAKLYEVGAAAFDFFKEGAIKLFNLISNSFVGEAVSDGWNYVKDTVSSGWNGAKEFLGFGGNADLYGNERQQANEAMRRGQNPSQWASETNKAIDKTNQHAYQASKQTAKAADYAMANALPESAGRCAKYVNDALRAQGVKVWGHGREIVGNLLASNQGFHEVKFDENYVPQKGDVMSMDAPNPSAHIRKYGVHAGHGAIFDGKEWVSDHKQGNKYGNTGAPGKSYYDMLLKDPSKARIARKGSYVNAPKLQQASHNNKAPDKSQKRTGLPTDDIPIVRVLEVGQGYNIVELADGSIVKQTGDWNWRNRNQGNIEDGSYAQSVNGMSQDGAKGAKGSKRFAAFSTFQDGRLAKQKLIFGGKNYRNINLTDAIARFAPPTENDTAKYQKTILSAVGGANKRMSDYSAEEQVKIMDAIEKHEGMKVGKVEVLRAANGSKTPSVQKVAVKTPPLVQPKSQQVALNANNVALNAANIQPQNIQMPTNNGNGRGLANQGSIGGQIAHAPIKRQVSHPEIANVTSGGTGA